MSPRVGAGTGGTEPQRGATRVDVFVSYAGPNYAWAEWVACQLREDGYTVGLDAWDWVPGDNFIIKMSDAMDAERVVALLSSAYFEEGRHTAAEWSAAMVGDDGRAAGNRLVPVQVEPCQVPKLLRTLLRVELFDVDEVEARRRLLKAVRGPYRPDGAPQFPGRGRAGALTSRGEAGPRLPGVLPQVWNLGPRTRGFVGRDADMALLRTQLRPSAAGAVVLHGLGGVGKTQLALEYAHRYAGSYDLVWRVNAEEAGLIGEEYAALAATLGLTTPHTDTASAASALRAYLGGRNRWLLLFDNAEEPADLHDWLPPGPGHILITSRNPGWGELAAPVEVDVLPRTESVTLIHTYRPGLDDADAGSLAHALGYLPLALVQAAGFLAETGMSVNQYLDLLKTHAGELLEEHPPQAHPVSLAAAVAVSTARLAKVDPAALGMVRVGAFLAPEPISADLLTGHIPAADPGWPTELAAVTAAVVRPVAAHRSLGRAGRYGLARIDDRGMQLHRLTQAILRHQLPAWQVAAYRDYAQDLLVAAGPGDYWDPENWPAWARILPHLLAADPATSPSSGLRELACHASWYLHSRGESHLARSLADHLYQSWRDHLGSDDRHTLRVAQCLTRALTDIGPYNWVRELGEDTLARSRRVLGDNHRDTLRAAYHLAFCLHELGDFKEARRLNEDTLTRRKQFFGDHLDTKRVAHNLGRDLRELDDIRPALRLHKSCVAFGRRELGDEHPYTLKAVNDLGATLRASGKVDEACQIHEDTLARARRVLGKDHIWTISCEKELARDRRVLGEIEEARRLGEKTLERARRVLGDDSHVTIDLANALAADLHALGEDKEARQLAEDTLVLARRVFGDNHTRTLRAAEILAAILRAAGEAEPGCTD